MECAHFYHCWCDGAWRECAEPHLEALASSGFDGAVTIGLVGAPACRDEARDVIERAIPASRTPGGYCGPMAIVPVYSKRQLRKAGRFLRDVASGIRTPSDDELWEAIVTVEWWRATHAKPLSRTNAGLRYYVQKAGADVNVTQRLKRFATIVDKLQRHPTMQLSTMEDIGGVRAVLPRQSQIDEVVREIRRQPRWAIKRVREYVSGRDPGPKPDGYRAVHVVVERDGCFIEIQLRTPWQDVWAQSVEQDTRRLRAGLKFGLGPADLQEYFRVIADYFELRERDEAPAQELLGELSKLFAATREYYPDEDTNERP